jgi:hypothetical protein
MLANYYVIIWFFLFVIAASAFEGHHKYPDRFDDSLIGHYLEVVVIFFIWPIVIFALIYYDMFLNLKFRPMKQKLNVKIRECFSKILSSFKSSCQTDEIV